MISNTKISQVVFWISVVIIFIGFMENINELRYNLMIPLIAIGWVLHFTYSDHKIDSHSTKSFILLSWNSCTNSITLITKNLSACT